MAVFSAERPPLRRANPAMIIGNATGSVQQYEKCSFRCGAASAGGDTIIFGPSSGAGSVYLILTDCTMKFAKSASVGVGLNNACRVVWKGSNSGSILASGSSVPTNLFISQATMSLQYATILFEGCDFTDFGTNQIVSSAGSMPRVQYTFKDCKANSAAVWGGNVVRPIGPTVDYIRCGVNNYTSGRYWYQGAQSTETTIILTGGASDGTTPISWKVIRHQGTRGSYRLNLSRSAFGTTRRVRQKQLPLTR